MILFLLPEERMLAVRVCLWVHSVVIKIKKNTNGETKFKVRCSKVIVRLECVSFVVPLHDGGEGFGEGRQACQVSSCE